MVMVATTVAARRFQARMEVQSRPWSRSAPTYNKVPYPTYLVCVCSDGLLGPRLTTWDRMPTGAAESVQTIELTREKSWVRVHRPFGTNARCFPLPPARYLTLCEAVVRYSAYPSLSCTGFIPGDDPHSLSLSPPPWTARGPKPCCTSHHLGSSHQFGPFPLH